MKYLFTSLLLIVWTFFLLVLIDIFVKYSHHYQKWEQWEFDWAVYFCVLTGCLYYFNKKQL